MKAHDLNTFTPAERARIAEAQLGNAALYRQYERRAPRGKAAQQAPIAKPALAELDPDQDPDILPF